MINKKCGKVLSGRSLDRLDMKNLQAARIIAMKGTERFLNIEQEVFDNVVFNTKRPISKKEILLNLHILGLDKIDIEKSFNKKKIADFFESFAEDVRLGASGNIDKDLEMKQGLDICTISFVNLSNYKSININRFHMETLIESISDNYQLLTSVYDNKEQKSLSRLIVSLIENYININRENEKLDDALNSISSIFKKAKSNTGHIFYNQKFLPFVKKAIEDIPRDVSGSSGSYYQEISRLFDIQDKDPAQDNTSVSKAQTEVALRSYVRMLLS